MFTQLRQKTKEESTPLVQDDNEDQIIEKLILNLLSNTEHPLRGDLKKWIKRKIKNIEKAKVDEKNLFNF